MGLGMPNKESWGYALMNIDQWRRTMQFNLYDQMDFGRLCESTHHSSFQTHD